jgi:hypothetical protein
MDRKALFLPLFLSLGCSLLTPLYAQNRAPDWYTDKELRYPSSRYIAAVGEGKSRADAESAALAGVSLFFNTKTEVRNQAIREFNEAVTNNTTDFSKKTYISESAVISSDQEFLGVHFADSFMIPQRQTWAALAYIDRREAAQIYESKISTNMAAINALTEDANRETEALYSCGLLFRALKLADLTEEYIKTAAAVDSQSAQKYAPYGTQIQALRSAYRVKRDGLTFAVRASAADETGRVERKLQELLEDNGYIITARNPQYSVSLQLTTSEEIYDRGIFIRSGIAIRLERNGKSLFSYSKNYDREGHKTLDGAYNRAFMAIEKDLEENFMAKLSGMIGQ